MTQAAKKPTAQPASKLASSVANKAAKNTYAAVESTRNSAENVVKIGSKAVKEFIASGASEAQKAHEKAFAFGRESADQLSKSADAVTKSLYEAIANSRDGVDTIIEIGSLTAALSKDLSGEVMEYANKAFSDSAEISKDLFAVRTINDFVELQNKVVKSSLDSFFSESAKLSGLLFEYSTDAFEPLNERFAQASEQLGKTLKAVKL